MKEVLFYEELFNVFVFYIKASRRIIKRYNLALYAFILLSCSLNARFDRYFFFLNAKRCQIVMFCDFWEIATCNLIKVNVIWKLGEKLKTNQPPITTFALIIVTNAL